MFYRILLLVVVLSVGSSRASLAEDFYAEPRTGNAPFFELPCMAVGGVCARSVACPKGTEVQKEGLCPVQQDLGMECCRAIRKATCSSKGGECLSPKDVKCPRHLHVGQATDCTGGQTCCVYVK